MNKSAFKKDILRTVTHGKKRFFSILAITALGVITLTGLRAACVDLRRSADAFFDQQNLYDILIQSTLGLTDDDVDALLSLDGVSQAEGGYTATAYLSGDSHEKVLIKTVSPSGMSLPYLQEGSLPASADGIAVTQNYLDDSGKSIGDTLTIEEISDDADDDGTDDEDDDSDPFFLYTEFTITGTVIDPADINNPDGSTSFRVSSTTDYTFFILPEAVDSDVYTAVYLTVENAVFYNCYSEEYTAAVSDVMDEIELTIKEGREQARTEEVKNEAQEEIDEAEAEMYEAFDEADQEIADAAEELSDARQELDDGWAEIEDGFAEIEDAQTEIDDGWATLSEEEQNAAEEIADARVDLAKADAQLEDARDELNENEALLEESQAQLDAASAELSQTQSETESSLSAALEALYSQKAELEAAISALEAAGSDEDGSSTSSQEVETDAAAENQADDSGDSDDDGSSDDGDESTADDDSSDNSDENAADDSSTAEDSDEDTADDSSTAEDSDEDTAENNGSGGDDEGTTDDSGDDSTGDGGGSDDSGDGGTGDGTADGGGSALETAKASLAQIEAQITALEAQAAEAEAQFAAAWAEIEENQAVLDAAYIELEEGRAQLEAAQEQLDEGESTLNEQEARAQQEFADARTELTDAQTELDEALEELYDGIEELEDGETEYADGLAEYEESVAEYEEERLDALAELEDAKQELADLEDAVWYVQDRTALSGYSNISSDSDAIESIGTAFPVIFLAVAILISLTTVTRMVEEERGLIGTYKALGFSDTQILMKYLVFSAAACAAGSAIGEIGGFVALPEIVFIIFKTMYALPAFTLSFDPVYGIAGPVIFLAGSALATFLALRMSLRLTPAILMRPKSPRPGSKVFLERIRFLWKRLSFLNKVTARNLFRYKKRLLMTVTGILGCTALLVCGFAIKDTVDDLMPRQYDDIYLYDLIAVADDYDSLIEELEDSGEVDGYMGVYIDNVTLESNSGSMSVQLIAVPDGMLDVFSSYINITDTEGGALSLDGSGIFVTRNAGQILDFSAGDTVSLQDMTLARADAAVASLVQNYLGNCVYMTQSTYEELFGEYETNGVLAALADTLDDPVAFAENLSHQDGVTSATATQQLRDEFSKAFVLINMVVYIIIILAAALAFVVLFTLSSTNISEREREIATIKVLGFYDREVHLYVNKETLILTVFGILPGLPVGCLLGHAMTYVLNMPSLYFAVSIHPVSYLYSGGLSLLFALLVQQITNRILNRINPVEALKSIE